MKKINFKKFIPALLFIGFIVVMVALHYIHPAYLFLIVGTAVDLTYDTSAIQTLGGQKAAYKRVKADGTDLTTPDTWHDFPEQAKLTFDFEKAIKNVTNRGGANVATTKDPAKIDMTLVIMQDDANTENFMMYEVNGEYFAIFVESGIDTLGKTKERFFPVVEIAEKYKSEEEGRRPEMSLIPRQIKTSVTPATLPTWAVLTAITCVVPAYRYHFVKGS